MVHLDYFCYCVSLRAGAFIIIVVDLIVCTIIIYGTRGKQEKDVISINVFDVKWKNRSFLPDSYFGLGVVQSCIKAERAAAICHCFGCVILFLGALIVSDAHACMGFAYWWHLLAEIGSSIDVLSHHWHGQYASRMSRSLLANFHPSTGFVFTHFRCIYSYVWVLRICFEFYKILYS